MSENVDRNRLVNDLVQMVQTPSVNCFEATTTTPPEGAMSDLLERCMVKLGLEVGSHVVADGRRNVWGRLRGTVRGPTILLAGHLDTVGVEGYNAPHVARLEAGKIHGRGACDMKAGLAAYLETIRILQHSSLPPVGDIIIAGVVDEEHAMSGSRYFGLNGPSVDFAIVAEPTELAICPTHKGQICLTIKTRGVAVHSSMPERGINAIWHMSLILNRLRDLAVELQARTSDPMCGKPSLSVGVIKGGTNVSSVPDICEIEVDRRTIPGESFVSVMAEYQQILDAISASHPNLDYEICAPALNVDPFHTEPTSPIVESIMNACNEVTGRMPVLTAFTGSTDAPNFRCPAVICGAGSLAQCHSLNEFIHIDEIVSAVQIYVKTIQNMQHAEL